MITQLGVGEALVSVLEDKGIPSIVERTLIRPPSRKVGPDHARGAPGADGQPRRSAAVYDKVEDRESAFEVLTRKTQQKAEAEAAKRAEEQARGGAERPTSAGRQLPLRRRATAPSAPPRHSPPSSPRWPRRR